MYMLAVWKRSFLKLKTIVESVLFVKGGFLKCSCHRIRERPACMEFARLAIVTSSLYMCLPPRTIPKLWSCFKEQQTRARQRLSTILDTCSAVRTILVCILHVDERMDFMLFRGLRYEA